MTPREVKKTGKKTFCQNSKIGIFFFCFFLLAHLTYFLYLLQFDDLERLGYRCLALGFFEEDVQAASSTDCECCLTSSTVQYMRALTIAGLLEECEKISHEIPVLNLLYQCFHLILLLLLLLFFFFWFI